MAVAAVRANAEGRREDYAELRSWGASRTQAAARLGIHMETVRRYERLLGQEVAA
ncbi:hypothetical protein [Nonomuraea sp. GTA35]|uniref:hypothetical protein n=1 Tax=Nonomuraea sp. GTA35 TaxID=1676746 RepID=UPI0035C0E98B